MIRRLAVASLLPGTACLAAPVADDDTDDTTDTGDDTTGAPMTTAPPGDSTTTDDGGDSTGAIEPAPVCAEYLECLAEDDPALAEQAAAMYGPEGSCWLGEQATADACANACEDGLATCLAGEGSTTGGLVYECTLDMLAPGFVSPVEVGEEPGTLPIEIGAILDAYCGCHLVDSADQLVPLTPEYNGALRIRTWDEFQQPFMGGPTYAIVQQRAITQLNMPPVYHCGTYDHGSFHAVDFEPLSAWLAAGAPDAPTWAAR